MESVDPALEPRIASKLAMAYVSGPGPGRERRTITGDRRQQGPGTGDGRLEPGHNISLNLTPSRRA